MYISSVPTVLTVRGSAVGAKTEDPSSPKSPESPRKLQLSQAESALVGKSFEESNIKNKFFRLFFWFRRRDFLLKQALVLYGLMVFIAVVEDKKFRTDSNFTLFNLMFECSSAYGSVGLSLGYPGTVTSFVAQFTIFGKLLMGAISILGRHRGLPSGLDAAYSGRIRLTSNPGHDDDEAVAIVESKD
jgi:hypothetical protein